MGKGSYKKAKAQMAQQRRQNQDRFRHTYDNDHQAHGGKRRRPPKEKRKLAEWWHWGGEPFPAPVPVAWTNQQTRAGFSRLDVILREYPLKAGLYVCVTERKWDWQGVQLRLFVKRPKLEILVCTGSNVNTLNEATLWTCGWALAAWPVREEKNKMAKMRAILHNWMRAHPHATTLGFSYVFNEHLLDWGEVERRWRERC